MFIWPRAALPRDAGGVGGPKLACGRGLWPLRGVGPSVPDLCSLRPRAACAADAPPKAATCPGPGRPGPDAVPPAGPPSGQSGPRPPEREAAQLAHPDHAVRSAPVGPETRAGRAAQSRGNACHSRGAVIHTRPRTAPCKPIYQDWRRHLEQPDHKCAQTGSCWPRPAAPAAWRRL